MESLPAEIIFRILRCISSPKAVQECKLISKTFHHIICGSYVRLARVQCAVTISFGEKLKVGMQLKDNDKKISVMHLQKQGEILKYVLSHKFSSIELCSLKLVGPIESDDTSLLHQILLVLRLTQQSCVRIFNLQHVNLKDEKMCENFFDFLAQKSCQQIIFDDCDFISGFSNLNLSSMEDLSQLTAQNCCIVHQFLSINKIVGQFAHCLRYKPRRNMPFYVRAPGVTAKVICQFLKNWIHLSQAPFFEIQVEDCSINILDELVQEAENESLSQIHLEFASLAHPTAHVKAKFNQAGRTLKIFPVVDVPARFVGQSICYARFYRDF